MAGAANVHKFLVENLSYFVLCFSSISVADDATQAYAETAMTEFSIASDGIDARQPLETPNTESISAYRVIDLIGAAIQQQQVNDEGAADTQTVVGLLPWDRLPSNAKERGDSRFDTLRVTAPAPKLSLAFSPRDNAGPDRVTRPGP